MLDAVDPVFEAVELSPLCPFGLNAALTQTNQKKIFSAVRGTEVMADLATALTVEAALRRIGTRPSGAVRLCSSHRLTRAQKYPEGSGFSPHFRMFGLVTADNDGFNAGDCLIEHVRQYLTFFASANRHGWRVARPVITIADLSITERMIQYHGINRDAVCARIVPVDGRLLGADAPFPATVADLDAFGPELRDRYGIAAQIARLARIGTAVRQLCATHFPDVRVRFALDRIGGLGHYDDVCFKIDGRNAQDQGYPLVDGGNTLWMSRLLSNRRERCFVSAIGTELFCRHYRAPPDPAVSPTAA